MKRKDFDAQAPSLTQREYAPQRWPSVKSDVSVPLLQATITGLMLSVSLTGLLWGVLGLDFTKTFGVTFSLSVVVAWFWRLEVITETLWNVEEATGLDLDRDGTVGKPQPSVRLEIAQGNRTEFVDIEGLEDTRHLRQFAILGLTNRLNERATKRAFGWPREHWQGVRDRMVDRGLAEWNGQVGSKQGVSLTTQGKETMQQVLEHTT